MSINQTRQKVNVARESNIQDEARSYRSKVGAIRIILKNVHTRRALIKYLENYQKAEYVMCFHEIEEIRLIKDDKQLRQQLKNIIASYKSVMEVAESKHSDQNCIEFALWDCFGPLRHTDIDIATTLQVSKYVHVAQDSLLSQVCTLFEEFLKSKEYENCKNYAVENQKIAARSPHAGVQTKQTSNVAESNVRSSTRAPTPLQQQQQQQGVFHGIMPT